MTSSLSSYALSSSLSDYVTTSALSGYNYVTPASLTSSLSSYALSSSLSDYVTTSALSGYNYVTPASLTSSLSSYALSSSLSGYVTTSSLSGYNYVTSESLSATLSSYDLSSSLSNYVTTSALSAYNYVTPASLTSSLSDYVLSSSLSGYNYLTSSSLSNYFNTAVLSTTDANSYISFNGSGNSITLNYDNLLSAIGTFLTSSSLTDATLSNPALTGNVTFVSGATIDFTGNTVLGLPSGGAQPLNTTLSNLPKSVSVPSSYIFPGFPQQIPIWTGNNKSTYSTVTQASFPQSYQLVTWITSTPNNSVNLTFTAPVGYTSTACTLALTVKLGTLVDFNLKINNAGGGVTNTYNSSDGLNTSTWTTIYYPFTAPASTATVMTVQVTAATANNLGTMFISNLQIYSGATPPATVLTAGLAIPYGDLSIQNLKVNNLPAVSAYAVAYIANSGTVSVSNTRGVTITASRTGLGLVTLTLGSPHPAGAFYTINATPYVVSGVNTNPVMCSVIKLPTTSSQFRIMTKDYTNTAVDCDFMVSIF